MKQKYGQNASERSQNPRQSDSEQLQRELSTRAMDLNLGRKGLWVIEANQEFSFKKEGNNVNKRVFVHVN